MQEGLKRAEAAATAAATTTTAATVSSDHQQQSASQREDGQVRSDPRALLGHQQHRLRSAVHQTVLSGLGDGGNARQVQQKFSPQMEKTVLP